MTHPPKEAGRLDPRPLYCALIRRKSRIIISDNSSSLVALVGAST
jgi:hypothetical protein